MSETHPVYKLIDRFAKFVYSKAAAISVISEGFAKISSQREYPGRRYA